MTDWLLTRKEFETGLGDYRLRHGTMRIMLYRPGRPNRQSPHEQDELYIIREGSGRFERAGELRDFSAGDAIFVPAGLPHSFVDFGDDLRAWVIFWGPKGGEGDDDAG